MTAPLRLFPLVVLIALTAACRPDPGKEEWTPPPAAAPAAEIQARKACSDRDPLRRPFYGDLHVHTHYSMDAWARGTRLTPDDAYRFASGKQTSLVFFDGEDRISSRVQIDRPLDFAAVTDHAEWLGEVSLCTTPGSAVYETKSCRIYRGEAESLIARLLGLEDIPRQHDRNRRPDRKKPRRLRRRLGALPQGVGDGLVGDPAGRRALVRPQSGLRLHHLPRLGVQPLPRFDEGPPQRDPAKRALAGAALLLARLTDRARPLAQASRVLQRDRLRL